MKRTFILSRFVPPYDAALRSSSRGAAERTALVKAMRRRIISVVATLDADVYAARPENPFHPAAQFKTPILIGATKTMLQSGATTDVIEDDTVQGTELVKLIAAAKPDTTLIGYDLRPALLFLLHQHRTAMEQFFANGGNIWCLRYADFLEKSCVPISIREEGKEADSQDRFSQTRSFLLESGQTEVIFGSEEKKTAEAPEEKGNKKPTRRKSGLGIRSPLPAPTALMKVFETQLRNAVRETRLISAINRMECFSATAFMEANGIYTSADASEETWAKLFEETEHKSLQELEKFLPGDWSPAEKQQMNWRSRPSLEKLFFGNDPAKMISEVQVSVSKESSAQAAPKISRVRFPDGRMCPSGRRLPALITAASAAILTPAYSNLEHVKNTYWTPALQFGFDSKAQEELIRNLLKNSDSAVTHRENARVAEDIFEQFQICCFCGEKTTAVAIKSDGSPYTEEETKSMLESIMSRNCDPSVPPKNVIMLGFNSAQWEGRVRNVFFKSVNNDEPPRVLFVEAATVLHGLRWLIKPDRCNIVDEANIIATNSKKSEAISLAYLLKALAEEVLNHGTLMGKFRTTPRNEGGEHPVASTLLYAAGALPLHSAHLDPFFTLFTAPLDKVYESKCTRGEEKPKSVEAQPIAGIGMLTPGTPLFARISSAFVTSAQASGGSIPKGLWEIFESEGHPLAKAVHKYLSLSSSRSAVISGSVGLQRCLHEKDKMIRGAILHTEVPTGRLSARSPNILAIHGAARPLLQSRFGPKHGVLIEADYSQLEVITLALLTGDKNMVNDVNSKVDFHCKRVGMLRPHLKYDDIVRLAKVDRDSEMIKLRKAAKTFSFQYQYGAGAKSIAAASGLSVPEVQRLIDSEHKAYPNNLKFLEWSAEIVNPLIRRGAKYAPLKLPSGTAVNVPENAKDRAEGQQQVSAHRPSLLNYPVQGFAAELVQLAVGTLWRTKFIPSRNYEGKAFLTNTVHDCVWVDCHESVMEKVVKDTTEVLQSIPDLIQEKWPPLQCPVPFPVEVSSGKNMGELAPYSSAK